MNTNKPTTMNYVKSIAKALCIAIVLIFALIGYEDVFRLLNKANSDASELSPTP